jgi:hypothetical protein
MRRLKRAQLAHTDERVKFMSEVMQGIRVVKVRVCILMHVYMYVCLRVGKHVWVFVLMYVCTFLIFIYIYTHTQFYAWELPFLNKIDGIRASELAQLKNTILLTSQLNSMVYVWPTMAAGIMFTVCIINHWSEVDCIVVV